MKSKWKTNTDLCFSIQPLVTIDIGVTSVRVTRENNETPNQSVETIL